MATNPLRRCTVCGQPFRAPLESTRYGCREHPDARPRRPAPPPRQRRVVCEEPGCMLARRVPADAPEQVYWCTEHRPRPVVAAPAWTARAACAGDDPRLWDGDDPADTGAAAAVCSWCPVASACLAYGRDTGAWGVWGGVRLQGGQSARPAAREVA